jgi:hypothetical protein
MILPHDVQKMSLAFSADCDNDISFMAKSAFPQ